MDRLVGRRALITGGGRGLGRAIALAFAGEGADVVVSFRRSGEGAAEVVRAAEALGVRAEAVRADLLDAEQIDGLVAAAAAALGGLDILVSNAGLYSSRPLLETTDDLWERLLAVNLTAPFRLARTLGPAML